MIPHSKPWITQDDIGAVSDQLASGMIAYGECTRNFEDAVAKDIGVLGAVAVSSGTAAIALALKALLITNQDEVILPTYICRSVVDAVLQVGAKPVFCDVGNSWNMTTANVTPYISKRTKAIIVAHIFGIVADIASFKEFGLPIIEDCAQAYGAIVNGGKAGAQGDIGIFSFHATKCLTTGEGGMVTTSNKDLLESIRRLKEQNVLSSPLSDMQAALGLSQLSRYDQMLKRRREIADRYFAKLPKHLTKNLAAQRKNSIFFRFPLLVSEEYATLCEFFENHGITVRKGVDSLLHRDYKLPDKDFPQALNLFQKTLSLPIYPALTDQNCDHIITIVNKACL